MCCAKYSGMLYGNTKCQRNQYIGLNCYIAIPRFGRNDKSVSCRCQYLSKKCPFAITLHSSHGHCHTSHPRSSTLHQLQSVPMMFSGGGMMDRDLTPNFHQILLIIFVFPTSKNNYRHILGNHPSRCHAIVYVYLKNVILRTPFQNTHRTVRSLKCGVHRAETFTIFRNTL